MRQHLHIPLTRHRKTTRHSRRVVWIVASFACLSILATTISRVWLTRNTVFQAAPENSQVAIQLLLNKRTWPILQQLLENTPLVSNRDLTITDIAPFAHGELGWFFHDDGTRSIAIRSQQDDIPTDLLDAKHVVVQETNPHVFLLSEKLQPISGLGISSSYFRNLFISPFSTVLGEYHEKNQGKSARISHRSGKISFQLPIRVDEIESETKYLPIETFLYLFTPVLSNNEMIRDVVGAFSHTAAPLFHESLQDFISNLASNHGQFLLANPENPTFLFASDADIPDQLRVDLLQVSLSLQNPSIRTLALTDGTSTKELIADPDLVPVELRTVEGTEFFRASTDENTIFSSKGTKPIVSNDENLIRNWLSQTQEDKKLMPCDTNIAFLETTNLLDANFESSDYYKNATVIDLLKKFSVIGMKSNGNKIEMHLCL